MVADIITAAMRWWMACVVAIAANAQTPSAESSLLDRVRARTDENLRRLPNYTCTETIERTLRAGRKGRLRPKDTVQLNVAYVEGRELFGRLGDHRIDQPDIGQFVDRPIGNGQFALFVKSIFVGQGGMFGSPVKTKIEGKQAFRFDYTIPLSDSGFSITSAVGKAYVGYSGSFWVARETLDLMRLIISADHLPPQLKMAYDLTIIDYGPVSIGGKLFPLPLRSKWETKDVFGSEARNIVTFENCHEFIGESVLKFGDAESSPPPK
jgi:hypothetical protein